MKVINVRTWNVDWFRNGKRSGKEHHYIIKDCNDRAYEEIVKSVMEFLEKPNAIVFMQEVPYKYIEHGSLHEHPLYKKIKKCCYNNNYDIFFNYNYNNGCVLRGTFAISKKGIFCSTDIYMPCNNRIIGVTKDDVMLLGVHMPTNFKVDDVNDKMWGDLIEYIDDSTVQNKKIIIAGDFNAYIGCQDKLTESRYTNLREKTKNDVCDDIPTFRGGATPIDHILWNFDSRNSPCVEIEDDEKSCSDHKYVQVELHY